MTCKRRRVEFAADDAGKPSVGKVQMVSVTTELRSKTAEPSLRLVLFPPRCSHFEAHTYAHTHTHTHTGGKTCIQWESVAAHTGGGEGERGMGEKKEEKKKKSRAH